MSDWWKKRQRTIRTQRRRWVRQPNWDWLNHVSFRPDGRYHLSRTPITAYYGTIKQPVGFKPQGLWYGCGDAWLTWMRTDAHDWIPNAHYLYEVTPGPNTLNIRTVAALDAFSAEYARDHGNAVDWPLLARRYSGIEICPYQGSRRLSALRWYYSWDVASGCLWGPDAHRIKLVAQQ